MTFPFLLVPLALVVGVTVFAAVMLLLWRHQERVVFQPPRPAPPPKPGSAAQILRYEADDGQQLHAYLVGPPDSGAPLVIAFHGNADLAEWLLPWARELHVRTGAAVLLPEYRGYGGLQGPPSYPGTQLDARAALRVAQLQLGVPSSRLVLFGHSLGSAVAAELAADAPPAALALQSPFTSARAMASRMLFPAAPFLWTRLSRVHFDTCARLADLETSVFVAHGDRDRVIPIAMGRRVYAAARVRGQLLVVPGAGHNDVPDVGQQAYWEWLAAAVSLGL